MEALDMIKSRRSIRKYTNEPITHDTMNAIVDAARFSPSWKNTQIARYYVIENKELKQKIADECVLGFAGNMKSISTCASLVVVSYITKRCGYERDGSFTTSKGDHWEMFDTGIASQTFCLAAHEKGVGTCIIGIFDEDAVAKAINLPENQKVGCLIAAGYPDIAPDAPPRKDVDVLVTYL